MQVATFIEIAVDGVNIENRHRGETATTTEQLTALIGPAGRIEIGNCTVIHNIGIDIKTANPVIQLQELRL